VAAVYCVLCGTEIDTHNGHLRRPVACGPQCAAALEALDLLRQREIASDSVAARRRAEYEQGVEHPRALSELMLKRWRAGDWTVSPDQVLAQLTELSALQPGSAPRSPR
jgi:hypothetical protein